jgi:large subunit ribosomal protein L21
MFAIIESGNQQYRVEKDTIFETELTGKSAGDNFNIDKVLLIDDNGKVEIGKPYLKKKVKVKVLADVKGKKINGFLYKKRKNYQRAWGHRQKLQKLQVLSIG